MTSTAPIVDTFTITEEILVYASKEDTFDSIITQMGEENQTPDGKTLSMKIEAHPGGRWYRDLGDGNGHLWGFVQSIKRGAMLEFWGPLFMSTGATSNLMYRLTEKDGGTLISFKHTVIGPFPEEHRESTAAGWSSMHARVKRVAESRGGK
ncbi:MAG: SRPBCC domain-containing protein [Gemmatimonadaceae bacterium]